MTNPFIARKFLRLQRSMSMDKRLYDSLTLGMDALDIVEQTKRVLTELDNDSITQQVAMDAIKEIYKEVEL